jgi:recombination protein RecA
VIVVDSVAALVPQAELDGDMGDANIGLQARLMSQAMRKLRGVCAINKVTVIFINQIREKVGVMYGSPEVTSGGNALKFYASIRIDVRRIGGADGKIMEGTTEIGYRMKLRLVKNKVGAPFKEAIVDNIYGFGVDKFADTIRFAVKCGAIDKAGTWLSFGDVKLGQGTDNAVLTLRDNSDLMEKIKAKIREIIDAEFEAAVAA